VGHVNWIEADDGGVQANIGLRQLAADEEILSFKDLFEAVERSKEWLDSI
jgi:hypothetical protein